MFISRSLMAIPVAVVIASFASIAAADAPLAPPVRTEQCSPDNHVCVDLDPKRDTSTVFRKTADGKRRVLWTLPSFQRSIRVSNDGHMLFVNIGWLPKTDDALDALVGILYRDGVLVRRFYGRDVANDLSELRATVSHYAWGNVEEFDDKSILHMTKASGDTLSFDTNGKLIPEQKKP